MSMPKHSNTGHEQYAAIPTIIVVIQKKERKEIMITGTGCKKSQGFNQGYEMMQQREQGGLTLPVLEDWKAFPHAHLEDILLEHL